MTLENTTHVGDEILSYVQSTTSVCYFDITELYRSWYLKDASGSSRNFGVALRYPRGVSTDAKYVEWYAARYAVASAYAPCVIVDYVSHAGLAPWCQYESMSAGRAGSAHVDLYNGNLVYEHTDMVSTGSRMPVSVSHIYNSCLSSDNSAACGLGWRTTLHQSLHKLKLGDLDYYVWTDGSGTEHYFLINGSEPYKDDEGMELKLNVKADHITIADKSHSVMTFPLANSETKVWLQKIEDSCGNTMSLTYSSTGKISIVRDGVGRETTFSYDENGMLASITAPDHPTVSYTYEENRLISIG